MKLLIAYDGSECSDAAIDAIPRMGFESHGVFARVMAVDVFSAQPIVAGSGEFGDLSRVSGFGQSQGLLTDDEKLRQNTARAATKIAKTYPGWSVEHHVVPGLTMLTLLQHINEFKPDLLIVGSHNKSMVKRILVGS